MNCKLVGTKHMFSCVAILFLLVTFPVNSLAEGGQEEIGSSSEVNDEDGKPVESEGESDEQDTKEEKALLYPDVSVNHWVYEDLQKLVEAGVTVRPLDQYFAPNKPIVRADLIRMILRAKGIVAPESFPYSQPRFKDVPQNMDAFYYIETAYSMAITNGKTKQIFEPYGNSTREESVALIIRSMGLEQHARSFNRTEQVLREYQDADQISPAFRPIIAFAIDQEMIQGKLSEDNQLLIEPKSFTSRSQAVAMIARFILPITEQLHTAVVDSYSIQYHTMISVEATAYSSAQPNLSDYTSTGLYVRYGIVAVDPDVIPYGTHLYIEGYGFAVAGDTGGSIKGNKIDVAYPTVAEALQFGRKKNVKVYILDNQQAF